MHVSCQKHVCRDLLEHSSLRACADVGACKHGSSLQHLCSDSMHGDGEWACQMQSLQQQSHVQVLRPCTALPTWDARTATASLCESAAWLDLETVLLLAASDRSSVGLPE